MGSRAKDNAEEASQGVGEGVGSGGQEEEEEEEVCAHS